LKPENELLKRPIKLSRQATSWLGGHLIYNIKQAEALPEQIGGSLWRLVSSKSLAKHLQEQVALDLENNIRQERQQLDDDSNPPHFKWNLLMFSIDRQYDQIVQNGQLVSQEYVSLLTRVWTEFGRPEDEIAQKLSGIKLLEEADAQPLPDFLKT